LQGSSSPADWFNAQHEPAFTTKNSTGAFSMILFDNGTYRPFPASAPCGSASVPCLYSTVPILDIDEQAKTAKVVFRYPSPYYSWWGGDAALLDNGDVEFVVANAGGKTGGIQSDAYEVTRETNPRIVWQLDVNGRNAYRSHRLPSLYPGVAW
jgi:arylsulfate sulfotransferase